MSDFASMAVGEDGQYRLAGGDARLWVNFVRRSRLNTHRSEIEGRPIHEPVDYIQVQQPGERDRVDRPVREEDKRRFPKQWEAFLEKAAQVAEGTPVKLLFPGQPHIEELLLDLKIQTVEQLAQLSEHGIERLGMDGRRYVEKARAALDQTAATAEITRMQRELEETKSQLQVYREANAQLGARLDALEAAQAEEAQPRRRRQEARANPSLQGLGENRSNYEPPPRIEVVE